MELLRRKELEGLVEKAKGREKKKSELLREDSVVSACLEKRPLFQSFLNGINEEEKCALLSLFALGEEEVISTDSQELTSLLKELVEVEHFYADQGGVVGYVLLFLKILDRSKTAELWEFFSPPLLNLSKKSEEVRRWIQRAFLDLPRFAAIYPVGGAGDRLDLRDTSSGEPLPAARLFFDGMTLLEGLFAELSALEYLYFKLEGKQLAIPVALMTSREKSNYHHIRSILESAFWFHRDPSSIYISVQSLTPIVTEEGHLSFQSPMKLSMKPGGHGVIWKLLKQDGIFKKFIQKGITKAFVRQINNPIISLDYTLLAFIGCGLERESSFGLIATERPVSIEEGMVVEKRRKEKGLFKTLLTNVEYTDFALQGLKDEAKEPGSPYSIFPANTNVLFADLQKVSELVDSCPLPGLVVNLKTSFPTLQKDGSVVQKRGGRLESTMQNIADQLFLETKEPLTSEEALHLPTFACFHPRQKTLSTTKRSYQKGGSLEHTPEKVFWDLMANHFELFSHFCGCSLPPLPSLEEYLDKGLPYLIHYHPALGPLYALIQRKFRGGRLEAGSTMQLDIAELDVERLHLAGSLVVRAVAPFGELNEEGYLHYGHSGGKCELYNVKVVNRGVKPSERMWEGKWEHLEVTEILIHGSGEFFAENVTLLSSHRFEVPTGHRMEVRQGLKGLEITTRRLQTPSWYWEVYFDETLEMTARKCYSNSHEPRNVRSH